MELRHLRYFVAVAEEGSLTVAAEKRLHTAQPSLSRQIRDLEYEVGVPLLARGVRGVELTAAGRAFLEHARLALGQAQAAIDAARRAAMPPKPSFAMGFLTGQELEWMPEAMHILRDELPHIDITISSQGSPELADGLIRGRLDLAFMRAEPDRQALEYRVVTREPLMVVMPSVHRLAGLEAVPVRDVANETFLGMSRSAPTLQAVIMDYLKRAGVTIQATHEVDNLSMAMSLVASTGGVTLLPAYARNFLPRSLTIRPLAGEVPKIDLVVGYQTANPSPILKLFLSRIDELIGRVSGKAGADR
jgi:LysR family hca operon transcriptional activator